MKVVGRFTKAVPLVVGIGILFLAAMAHAQAAAGFVKINTAPVAGTAYTDASCPDNVSCYYQVTAVDSAGFESKPSTCASTATCVAGTELVVGMPSTGTHTVALNWTASTSTGVSYNVYQHVGPFPASNLGGTVN
jgi:hypothetical protein